MSEPIIIYRSVNRDGETYAIEPRSLEALRARFGDALHPRARLFVSHEAHDDHEHIQAAIVPQVVQLLTGLPEDRVRSCGEIMFWDPATDQELPRQ